MSDHCDRRIFWYLIHGHPNASSTGDTTDSEFSMEYFKHIQVPKNTQEELMKKYKEEREAKLKAA